jgi:ketosteroid isomerase-like protein
VSKPATASATVLPAIIDIRVSCRPGFYGIVPRGTWVRRSSGVQDRLFTSRARTLTLTGHGASRAHQQIQEFFGRIFELSGGTFSNEIHDILANDEHAAVMVRSRAQRPGKSLDALTCHVWHLKNGKATEFWNLTVDPYAADEFWS